MNGLLLVGVVILGIVLLGLIVLAVIGLRILWSIAQDGARDKREALGKLVRMTLRMRGR